MATVNGTEYDHIDIVNGSTTTKHMLKDATARGDIEDLKSAIDEIEDILIPEVPFDLVWSQGNISDSTGIPGSTSVGAIRTDTLYDVSDSEKINMTFVNGSYPDTIVATVFLYDESETFLSKIGKHPGTYEIDVSSASYVRFKVARNDSTTELSPSDGNALIQASKVVENEYATVSYVDEKVDHVIEELNGFEATASADIENLENAFENAFIADIRMPLVWSQGNISDSTGIPGGTSVGAIRTDALYDVSGIDVLDAVYNNGSYPSNIVFTVYLYDNTETFLSKIGKYAGTYEIDVSSASYVRFKVARNDSTTELNPNDGSTIVKIMYKGTVEYASKDYVDEKIEPIVQQVTDLSELAEQKPIKDVTLGWQMGNLSDSGTESGSTSSTSIRCVYAVPVNTDKLTLIVPGGYKVDVHFYSWYVYKDSASHYSTILKNQTGTVEIEVPEGYNYVRLVLTKTDGSDVPVTDGRKVALTYIDGNLGTASTDFVNHHSEYISLSMFQTIGVIGDSFASGSIYYSSTVSAYPLSWPQVMGRKIGADVVNYTEGGLSTKDWLTDANHGLPALLADTVKQLYILALGINDNTQINAGTLVLGTLDDITDDYTQNPESFYGNYGRIIGNIQAHAPNAKIVILSIARPIERNMDTHLVAIAEKCGLPYIQLTDDEYFNSGLYFGSMVSNHPLAYGYAGMANAIQRLIEKSIADNTSYFASYKG